MLAVSALILAFTFPTISLAGGDSCKKHDRHHESMHGHGKGHAGYAHMVLSKSEKLDLSNDQLGSIMRIQIEYKKARKAFMKKLHENMLEAYKGLMNPAIEENTIRDAAKKHTDALNKLVEDALKERSEVNAVLTEKQKSKLASIKNEHGDKNQ